MISYFYNCAITSSTEHDTEPHDFYRMIADSVSVVEKRARTLTLRLSSTSIDKKDANRGCPTGYSSLDTNIAARHAMLWSCPEKRWSFP